MEESSISISDRRAKHTDRSYRSQIAALEISELIKCDDNKGYYSQPVQRGGRKGHKELSGTKSWFQKR